jgi:hypothetical protein
MQASAQLLELLDEAFDHKAWHGTTLLGSVRGLKARAAAKRPAPGRHSIWELTVHAAYWKYAVRRSLTAEKRGSFALTGSNWFVRPTAGPGVSEQAWKENLRLLIDEHKRLRSVVAKFPERSLGKRLKGSKYTAGFLIRGIAAHDLYHAGQIQLIKRLIGTS